MMLQARLFAIIGISLLVAACGSRGTLAPVEGEDNPAERITVAPVPATRIAPPKKALSAPPQAGSALSKLRLAALSQHRAGKYTRAAATLERALRIAPRDAMLWQQLATVRLRQKKWRLALNMAAKSNALAGEQRTIRQTNWLIMAEAYRALGQPDKAKEIMQRRR
ncbi:MAG: tetratricopeptide repeat protein [Sulfuriflexus sp.]|nr:tetratricopeptide repeat protein [Sulfuriflexus sp.]